MDTPPPDEAQSHVICPDCNMQPTPPKGARIVIEKCERHRPRADAGRCELRPAVRDFAEAMEMKLRTHDKDRGSDGWLEDCAHVLCDRLDDEARELRKALGVTTMSVDADHPKAAKKEAVDVANFAMMVWDRIRTYDE